MSLLDDPRYWRGNEEGYKKWMEEQARRAAAWEASMRAQMAKDPEFYEMLRKTARQEEARRQAAREAEARRDEERRQAAREAAAREAAAREAAAREAARTTAEDQQPGDVVGLTGNTVTVYMGGNYYQDFRLRRC